MLEYIWFIVLILVAAWLSWMYVCAESEGRDVEDGFRAGQWLIGSFSAAMMALVISWERTGNVLLSSLMISLPQAGSQIAILTAYVLTGVFCLAVAGGIPLVFMMLFYALKERAPKQHPASN